MKKIKEKKLFCVDCNSEAEYIDKEGYNELLCLDCAEERALSRATVEGDFEMIEDLDADELDELIEKEGKEEGEK